MQRNSTRISVPVLILAAICCVLTANRSLRADTIYSVQFENNQGFNHPAVNFSGVEPDAAAANANFSHSNVWNHLAASGGAFSSSLVESTGGSAGAQLSIQPIDGAFNAAASFPDTYFLSFFNSSFTISGLERDSAFTLFLYAFNADLIGGGDFREAVFTVDNSSFDSANGTPSSLDPRNVTTGDVTGVTSATGSITGTWHIGPNNPGPDPEIDWAGFQLDVASRAASVPEPATLALLGTGLMVLAGAAWRRRLA